MNHQPLLANDAVLFIFEDDRNGGFWNKNVTFPIDVAFFDKDQYLINIEKLKEGQLISVKSRRPYKYVIETRLNWFKENNITEGVHMDSITGNTLKKLGFTKTAVYDPTVEENTQDPFPPFKQVDHLPTGAAIEALAND